MPLDPVKVDIRSTFESSGTRSAVVEMDKVGGAARKTAADTQEATKAQRDAEIATERFVAKLREEAETLGMTALQVKAYAASKKSFSDAQALSVAQSLTAIKAHEEERARVEKISAAVGVATKAVVAFVSARVAAQAVSVNSVLADADELNKESQALSVAVDWLSKLRYAGDLANISSGELRNGLRQLNRQIEEADNGTGNGRQLFERMGISIYDVTGKVKTLDQLLPELADKFSSYADGPRKTALALEYFGRDGLRWIPLLNGGAQGLRENAAEAERLGIVLGGDLARNSENFKDNLTRLKAAADAVKISFAEGVLPTLSAYIERLNEGIRITGSFGRALWLMADPTPKGEVKKQLDIYNKAITATGASGSDFTARARYQELYDYQQFLQRQDALTRWNPAMRDEASRFAAPKIDAPNIPKIARGGGGGSSTDPYAAATNYVLSLQNQLESAQGELTPFEKTVREITEGTKKFTAELEANALAISGELTQVLEAKKALDAYLKTVQADMEAQKEHDDLLIRRQTAIDRANVAASEEAERIRFETSLLKLNGVELEKVIALKRMERERPAGMRDTEFNRNVAAVQAAIDERGRVQEMVEGRRQTQDEIKRLADDTARSLTDAIIVGGKNGFRDLGQLALRTFQNLVLRPLIEPQIRTAAGETVNWVRALQGLFGGSGIDMTQITAAGHAQNLGAAAGAFPMEHSGYGPGDPYGPSKVVSMAAFARAPRFHSGIGPNERAAIIRKDESVLTPGQMRQLAPVGAQQPMRVEIVNSGAPKEVQSATPRIDVDGAVVRVVLADMARNGPLAQGLSNTFNLRRG